MQNAPPPQYRVTNGVPHSQSCSAVPELYKLFFEEDDCAVTTEGSLNGTALRGEVIELDDSADPDFNDYSKFGTSRPGPSCTKSG